MLFHDRTWQMFDSRTCALLGHAIDASPQSTTELDRWAACQGIVIPESFAEWAVLGGREILDWPSRPCLDLLRSRFEELVTTHFIADGARYDEYRFWRSPRLRMTAVVQPDSDTADITITGIRRKNVTRLERELRGLLGTPA